MEPNEFGGSKAVQDTRLRATFTVDVEILGLADRKMSESTAKKFWALNLEEDSSEEVQEVLNQARSDTGNNWEPRLSISCKIIDDQHDASSDQGRSTKEAFDHLVNSFPVETEATVIQLLCEVMFVAEAYKWGPDAGSRARKTFIKNILKEAESRLNQRLPKHNGRPRDKDRHDYPQKRWEFFCTCLDALKKIEKQGKKLTQANLALQIDSDKEDSKIEDPIKALSKQMKKNDITMDQLLACHRGKDKKAFNTFLEDDMAVMERIMS